MIPKWWVLSLHKQSVKTFYQCAKVDLVGSYNDWKWKILKKHVSIWELESYNYKFKVCYFINKWDKVIVKLIYFVQHCVTIFWSFQCYKTQYIQLCVILWMMNLITRYFLLIILRHLSVFEDIFPQNSIYSFFYIWRHVM